MHVCRGFALQPQFRCTSANSRPTPQPPHPSFVAYSSKESGPTAEPPGASDAAWRGSPPAGGDTHAMRPRTTPSASPRQQPPDLTRTAQRISGVSGSTRPGERTGTATILHTGQKRAKRRRRERKRTRRPQAPVVAEGTGALLEAHDDPDEPEAEGGVGVREPRRPVPPGLSGAAALPVPDSAEDA
jgi:hypothetical protein